MPTRKPPVPITRKFVDLEFARRNTGWVGGCIDEFTTPDTEQVDRLGTWWYAADKDSYVTNEGN